MKIAYIITHLGQTGVNNVVLDLVKGMQSHGHHCIIYYFKEVDAIQFPCETQKLTSLFDKIDFSAFDVIHSHGLQPDLYVMLHRPVHHTHTLFVSTLHCYVFQDFCDLYGKINGFILSIVYLISKSRHDKIVTLSQDAMHYYEKYYCCKRLTYAYNTRDIDITKDLDDKELYEFDSFKGDDIVIGMNCVLLMRKGIDIMLKALTLLPSKFKLYIVGHGPHHEAFEKMVLDLSLSDRVFFAGKRNEAYRYLKHYDVYALPSRSEGFPLSLLEAAACGCKVVCSDLSVICETFNDNEVSMFHLPNAQGLANAVVRAISDKDMSSNIKEKFIKTYSPIHLYQRYFEIYNT